MTGSRQSQAGETAPDAAVRFFQGLDPAARADVVAAATRVRRARGSSIFRQGSAARSFHVLQEGRVKLTQLNRDGQLVLLRFVVPGEALGGIAALERRTYPVSAEAVDDCLLLTWDGRTMDRLLRQHPQLAINLLDLVIERLHDMQARYEELATQQVEQRLARMLLRLVRRVGRRVDAGVLIDIRLSRQDLAEMAGTSLFTASRILTRWQESGVIRSQRQRILVCHPHGLVSIAEALPEPPAGDRD